MNGACLLLVFTSCILVDLLVVVLTLKWDGPHFGECVAILSILTFLFLLFLPLPRSQTSPKWPLSNAPSPTAQFREELHSFEGHSTGLRRIRERYRPEGRLKLPSAFQLTCARSEPWSKLDGAGLSFGLCLAVAWSFEFLELRSQIPLSRHGSFHL